MMYSFLIQVNQGIQIVMDRETNEDGLCVQHRCPGPDLVRLDLIPSNVMGLKKKRRAPCGFNIMVEASVIGYHRGPEDSLEVVGFVKIRNLWSSM
mmetsp:Transcript_28310/g.38746  ORF Transcript_28310/g.38746 Transcript_28310/m.38746 type:complete len:95 (+) Transcript_28310:733-1017(+)